MAKVLLENVIKKYGDVTALRDIYLDVRENEFSGTSIWMLGKMNFWYW